MASVTPYLEKYGLRPLPNRSAVECSRCGHQIPFMDIERAYRSDTPLHVCETWLDYMSPSMGRVRLRPYETGYKFETPAEVESFLVRKAFDGLRLQELWILPAAWPLLSSCFGSLGAGSPKKKWDLLSLSDAELVGELMRRDTQIPSLLFSDEKLRSECNRRWGEDDCPMAQTLRHERDGFAKSAEKARLDASVAEDQRDSMQAALDEVDAVIAQHVGDRAVHRAGWIKEQLAELESLRRLRDGHPLMISGTFEMPKDVPRGRIVYTSDTGDVLKLGDVTLRGPPNFPPENGDGIKRLDLRRDDTIDLATLADLVAADE